MLQEQLAARRQLENPVSLDNERDAYLALKCLDVRTQGRLRNEKVFGRFCIVERVGKRDELYKMRSLHSSP